MKKSARVLRSLFCSFTGKRVIIDCCPSLVQSPVEPSLVKFRQCLHRESWIQEPSSYFWAAASMTEEYVCHIGSANGTYSPCSSRLPSGKFTADPLPLVMTELGGNFVLVSKGSRVGWPSHIVPIKVTTDFVCGCCYQKKKIWSILFFFSQQRTAGTLATCSLYRTAFTRGSCKNAGPCFWRSGR